MKFQNPNIYVVLDMAGIGKQQTKKDKPIFPTNFFKVCGGGGGVKMKVPALMVLRIFF